MTFGGIRFSSFGMQWLKLIQDRSSTLSYMMPLLQLSYGWAAQVFRCFAEHGKYSLSVAGGPVEVQPDELHLAFEVQQQAAVDAVPSNP